MSSKKPREELRAITKKYCEDVLPKLSDPRHRVCCVDECYFSERVLPLYGYSSVGTKCVVRAPTGGWKKRSLLLSVSSAGERVHAVYDGSVNGQRFADFVCALPYPSDSTTVVLDNVAFHKNSEPFKQKGFAQLFIPPYSPDFNGPVENSFSKIKNHFRRMWPWQQSDGTLDVDACIEASVGYLTDNDIRASFKRLRRLTHGFQ